MSPLFKKASALDKRLKKIQKELSSVNHDIDSLAKKSRVADAKEPAKRLVENKPSKSEEHAKKDLSRKAKKDEKRLTPSGTMTQDHRFASYLMSKGFDTSAPLHSERKVHRNKGFFMFTIVILALWWLLYHFVL